MSELSFAEPVRNYAPYALDGRTISDHETDLDRAAVQSFMLLVTLGKKAVQAPERTIENPELVAYLPVATGSDTKAETSRSAAAARRQKFINRITALELFTSLHTHIEIEGDANAEQKNGNDIRNFAVANVGNAVIVEKTPFDRHTGHELGYFYFLYPSSVLEQARPDVRQPVSAEPVRRLISA